MQRDDVVSLSRRLLWGTASTRQQLAEELAPHACGLSRALLVETARSDEPWLLRARCLEVLGLVAGQAEQPVAEEILAQLFRRRGRRGGRPVARGCV